jgi:hypothetical protein
MAREEGFDLRRQYGFHGLEGRETDCLGGMLFDTRRTRVFGARHETRREQRRQPLQRLRACSIVSAS